MTAVKPDVPNIEARRPFPPRRRPKGAVVYQLITTTDHKVIGVMYMMTAFGFFLAAGLMALLMRSELAEPGLQFLSNEQYNQLFTRADYLPTDGFTTLNIVSTLGAFILGVSTLVFLWNVFKSYRYGEVVTVDHPWGYGNALEWATSCPPPGTISPNCRASAPNARLSNCTIPI